MKVKVVPTKKYSLLHNNQHKPMLSIYSCSSGTSQVITCISSYAKGILSFAFYMFRPYTFPICTHTSFYTHIYYTTAVKRNSPHYQKILIAPTQTHTRSWFKRRIIIIGLFLLYSWNLNILPHSGSDFTSPVVSPFQKFALSHQHSSSYFT